MYVSPNLKWYERGSFMTYIDQLKCKELINNTDDHFQKVKVINFNIIHKQCKGEKIEDKDLKNT